MGRKIKHYSSGYQIRRKKQRRVLGSLLFGLLLVFLVFVGYVGARALNEMRLQQGNDSSLPESSVVTEDNSSLPESDSLSSESEVSSTRNLRVLSLKAAVKQKHFTPSMAILKASIRP